MSDIKLTKAQFSFSKYHVIRPLEPSI